MTFSSFLILTLLITLSTASFSSDTYIDAEDSMDLVSESLNRRKMMHGGRGMNQDEVPESSMEPGMPGGRGRGRGRRARKMSDDYLDSTPEPGMGMGGGRLRRRRARTMGAMEEEDGDEPEASMMPRPRRRGKGRGRAMGRRRGRMTKQD